MLIDSMAVTNPIDVCFLSDRILEESGGESDVSFNGSKIVYETVNDQKR
jgi:hypothetical protein